MSIGTKKDFFLLLRKCELLTPDQLNTARESVRDSDDPVTIATRLCRDGWLTTWQAKSILAGKTTFHVANYTLVDVLGQGKMGTVFKACQSATGKTVALKLMSAALNSNSRMVARFKREIQLISGLRHPNVVSALDAGRASDRYFLVTEYVPGKDLLHWIRGKESVPVTWACECVRQGLWGLQYIHEKGLIHRDIKPSNLMVTAGSFNEIPQVKVLDLGLGRFVESNDETEQLTRDGHTVGTIDFMAPEQVQSGRAADIRSDIYAFGCTLFQALTRQLPFQSDNLAENIAAKLTRDAPKLNEIRTDVPVGLAEIVARMLSRNPDKRPASPRQAAEALVPFSMAKPAAPTVKPAPLNGKSPSAAGTTPVPVHRPLNVERRSADQPPAKEKETAPEGQENKKQAPRKPPRSQVQTLVLCLILLAGLCTIAWLDVRRNSSSDTAQKSVQTKPPDVAAPVTGDLPGKRAQLPKITGAINVGPRGHFKTIGEAINYVREDAVQHSVWTPRTIKVAGFQVFSERIHVDNSDFRFPKGLTIVCTDQRPAILSPKGPGPVIRLDGVERFALEGFEIDATGAENAIELEGYLIGTRLSKLQVTGISHNGILVRGASGFRPPQSRCVIEGLVFRSAGADAKGICIQSQATPSANITISRCRFFGPFESAIEIDGSVSGIEIGQSLFSELRTGLHVVGAGSALQGLALTNNSFHRLSNGVLFEEMPSHASGNLILNRNIFTKIAASEMSVRKGFQNNAFLALFAKGSPSENWTDRPGPTVAVPEQTAIFANRGKTGAVFEFESDDPMDSRFLRPRPNAPHKVIGAIVVK